ncbi:AzlD family protein [Alsobacter sp. SYSU BS001988]|jgi:uncharacterized membrane protein
MTVDATTLAAILAMAAVTYATRAAGLFLVGRLRLAGRARAAFEAIPAAVLIAVIAPALLATGKAETAAAAITTLAATRLPLLGVVGVGVASIVALRSLGL